MLGAYYEFKGWMLEDKNLGKISQIKMDSPKTLKAVWETVYPPQIYLIIAILILIIIAVLIIIIKIRKKPLPPPPPPSPPNSLVYQY